MTPEEFIFERAMPEPNSGCWLWLLKLDKDGYGCLKKNGKHWRSHRYAYETLVGPIPDGLEIDHLCRNKSCCNPSHLEVVTTQQNIQRRPHSDKVGKYKLANTHCPHGHPYSGDNLRVATNGQRVCRTCMREFMRRKRAPERNARLSQKAAEKAARDAAIRSAILDGYSIQDICIQFGTSAASLHRRFKIRTMRKRRQKAIHMLTCGGE